MKTLLTLMSLLFSTAIFAAEADSTGMEGDHLDLNAVMALFQDSESPEDFEKKLNTESSQVNNLDLDGDGEVDYIRVVDNGDSISHVLTLQVPVSETESQDVAVIELEETSTDVVEIQIVGDEDLYGENYILLPESAGKSPLVVNVITWRAVRFMWGRNYKPWVSPWRYRHYPSWHKPWKRKRWNVYRGHVARYNGHCRRVYARSFSHAHNHHYHRTHSASFHKAHHNHKTAAPSKGNKAVKSASPKKSTNSNQKTNLRKRPGRKNTGGSSSKSGSGSKRKN